MKRLAASLMFLVVVAAPAVMAQQGGVARTVHNLSVSGPGQVKSLSETEICKFCHIPHHPVVREQLWNQPLSSAQYQTPVVKSAGGKAAPAPQPDGASRLCLSCHDGTVAIGNNSPGKGGGRQAPRLVPGNRGFRGTDLSGSHPVSFTVSDSLSVGSNDSTDMGLKPLASIAADRDVRLDSNGKMQCTSCHDPHDDRNYQPGKTPHFMVKPTTSEVCIACHELR